MKSSIEIDNDIPVESVSLQSLSSASDKPSVQDSIKCAFGREGTGIIFVHDLPPEYHLHRKQLLNDGNKIPSLNDDEIGRLNLYYSSGPNNERLSMSLFANPIYDDPTLGDSELSKKYPYNMASNNWPSSNTLRHFEDSFKYLGNLMNETAIKLASHMDEIVITEKNGCYKGNLIVPSLSTILQKSRSAKGRLLHYFPLSESNSCGETLDPEKMWLGFHNDQCLLTGLLPAQYFSSLDTEYSSTGGGLCVKSTFSTKPKIVEIPPNCLAFQVGETAQILTGGVFRARPHGVVPPSVSGVSRVNLVIFFQPNPWVCMNLPDYADKDCLENSDLVLPMQQPLWERFKNGNTFYEFLNVSLTTLKY